MNEWYCVTNRTFSQNPLPAWWHGMLVVHSWVRWAWWWHVKALENIPQVRHIWWAIFFFLHCPSYSMPTCTRVLPPNRMAANETMHYFIFYYVYYLLQWQKHLRKLISFSRRIPCLPPSQFVIHPDSSCLVSVVQPPFAPYRFMNSMQAQHTYTHSNCSLDLMELYIHSARYRPIGPSAHRPIGPTTVRRHAYTVSTQKFDTTKLQFKFHLYSYYYIKFTLPKNIIQQNLHRKWDINCTRKIQNVSKSVSAISFLPFVYPCQTFFIYGCTVPFSTHQII